MAAISRRAAITAAKRDAFLAALAAGRTVTDAAKVAGATREGFRLIRKRDQVFAEAWDDAYEQGADLLEGEALRRAVEGVERPIVSGGKVVTTVREYSDKLLILLLKGRRPEKYAHFEVTGRGGSPVQLQVEQDPDRLGAVVELAARLGLLADGGGLVEAAPAPPRCSRRGKASGWVE
jgi:hypothetical protein